MIVAPILMSGPMVRALLAGTKSQTRRLAWQAPRVFMQTGDGPFEPILVPTPWKKLYDRWQAGERDVVIWVRETWSEWKVIPTCTGCRDTQRAPVAYLADELTPSHPVEKWRRSIHMPRRLSRLTLVVSDLRMERLQDISEADALAEGATHWAASDPVAAKWPPVKAFAELWDEINARRAPWSSNPECVVVVFKPILANVDALASPDTGPLAHCTCDGNGPDGTGHLPDCGYWRAKEPT